MLSSGSSSWNLLGVEDLAARERGESDPPGEPGSSGTGLVQLKIVHITTEGSKDDGESTTSRLEETS